ncbi:MAG: hypothetical protein K6T16_02310 [Candidatus Pacearchaeota archaeon]|nr:hypothetical protein [Candidatus Pacearchaeota archaeon]
MGNSKELFLVFTVMALIVALPFASAAMQQTNRILPVIGTGKGEMTREQLREKFIGEESFRAELRNRIRECVGSETEECKNARNVAKEVMKGVMNRACNNYGDVAERAKERIGNSKMLSDEEKEALKKAIDEQTDKFQELCGKIEGATPEELREIAKEMRQLMKETKIKFGIARELVHAKRVGLVIERAEHLETKLQDFIEKWNCNSEELQPLIDEFNSKVAEAREAYDESVELWQQFRESVKNHEPNTKLLREAQAKMQLAQLKLKEAHVVLKEIIGELRECRQGAEMPVEPPNNGEE